MGGSGVAIFSDTESPCERCLLGATMHHLLHGGLSISEVLQSTTALQPKAPQGLVWESLGVCLLDPCVRCIESRGFWPFGDPAQIKDDLAQSLEILAVSLWCPGN